MTDQDKFERLLPLAYQWAKTQEAFVLEHGTPLAPRQTEDAQRVAVQNPSRVRLLLVDRIPLPDDAELAEATRRAQIITDASRAVTIGHGIIVRADSWQDRELLVHALVHVAQCERSGGLERVRRGISFQPEHLCQLQRRLARRRSARAGARNLRRRSGRALRLAPRPQQFLVH